MESLTPIRVRGKRGVKKTKKDDSGKQRNGAHISSSTSEKTSSARSTPSAGAASKPRRRKKQRDVELSRLEELPTEMLQAIFEYSVNLNLPMVSKRLSAQLASEHLHHSLTSLALLPVLDGRTSSNAEFLNAKRLMNSNFFTWPFFQSWLHQQFEQRELHEQWKDDFGSDDINLDQQEEWIWYRLEPGQALAPPVKLLRGPFTADKIRFLRFLTSSFGQDADDLDAAYIEKAQDGLRQAISEGAGGTLQSFWTLGLEPDTELLRHAIIDSGCDKELVRSLVTRVLHLASDPIDVDFLDPQLWSWAERAQARGDDKGPWLKDLLKDAARESGRSNTEIKHARSILYM